MKLRKGFKKEYLGNWVQTVSSVAALLFLILVNFGVLTPEQSVDATALFSTTIGAVSTVIAGVIGMIGLFFKPSDK
jgi:hypothetical protein